MDTLPPPRRPVPIKAQDEPAQHDNEFSHSIGGTSSTTASSFPSKLFHPNVTPSGSSTQPSLSSPSPPYTDITTESSSKMKSRDGEGLETTTSTTAAAYPTPEIVTIDGKQYLAVTPAIQSQIEAYEQYLVTYQQYYTQWYQWYNATYLSNTTTTTTTGNRTGPQVSTTLPNPNQEQPTPTVPVNAADNAEAERQRAARRATIVWLAAKLMLVLFVLTRHASIPRMIFIYVCAFIFFLYQTGQLRFIVRRVRPWRTTQATPTDSSRDTSSVADQPITRRRIIERGVYTFVASLFPSYGHDPRLAEAIDNAQQDEVR
ncbi:hypothetical protein BGW37DRAFT_210626 [Umbelopsis sp. PMI_123]|nr:hypothetical protein BGW37DRAFT_210626 [Umbelopsis sp. PMI_123]